MEGCIFFLNKYSKSCIYYSFIIHSTTSVEIGGKNKGVEEKRATDTSRPSPSVQTLRKSKPWPWPQEPVAQQEGKQRHAQCSMLPGGLAESRRTSKEGTTRLPWGAHRTRPFSLCMVGRGGGQGWRKWRGPSQPLQRERPSCNAGQPEPGLELRVVGVSLGVGAERGEPGQGAEQPRSSIETDKKQQ